uniref:Uncharacterized protein n=1 Tax=Dulem virus 36 TaxID=3145754 RepID=A0AAU8B0B6_9CAUD
MQGILIAYSSDNNQLYRVDSKRIMKGTTGYYYLEFMLPDEWENRRKVAHIRALQKQVYLPIIENRCNLPDGFNIHNAVNVCVVTKDRTGKVEKTNYVRLKQT